MVFTSPTKAKEALALNIRERRLSLALTQAGLSSRSGVALATLRKFEQTGAVSIDNLFKLMLVVGGLEELLEATAPDKVEFSSIDEVLAGSVAPRPKRGSRS